MFRMTRQADYGIVLLACFAQREEGDSLNARDLAAEVHLPVPMASKILKALARAGLLASQRGVNGGYRLARRPDQISLAEIINALEGPIGITDCSSGDHSSCNIAALCAVRGKWQSISGAMRDALGSISLASMAGPRPLPPARERGKRARKEGTS
ncbi:MAG: SUF system Fe-S cluster assembly regulator [Planctomycetes bacterium]|nr:SUF system Fe-S cluster assembly regulator [Planctomycetota bacterium]